MDWAGPFQGGPRLKEGELSETRAFRSEDIAPSCGESLRQPDLMLQNVFHIRMCFLSVMENGSGLGDFGTCREWDRVRHAGGGGGWGLIEGGWRNPREQHWEGITQAHFLGEANKHNGPQY